MFKQNTLLHDYIKTVHRKIKVPISVKSIIRLTKTSYLVTVYVGHRLVIKDDLAN